MIKEILSKYGLQMICLGPIFTIVAIACIIASLEQMVGKPIGFWFTKEK